MSESVNSQLNRSFNAGFKSPANMIAAIWQTKKKFYINKVDRLKCDRLRKRPPARVARLETIHQLLVTFNDLDEVEQSLQLIDTMFRIGEA